MTRATITGQSQLHADSIVAQDCGIPDLLATAGTAGAWASDLGSKMGMSESGEYHRGQVEGHAGR